MSQSGNHWKRRERVRLIPRAPVFTDVPFKIVAKIPQGAF
jgi:hypothetical protein